MLLADTCAEGSLTAACLSGDIILDRFARGDRTKVQKSATSPCCTAHSTRHPDWTHNSEHSSRPVGGEVRAELQPRRRPREPICRGRGAGVGKRARRGRGRARLGGAPRGGHARGGGGGSRERDWEARGVAPAARARSARSAQLGDDEGDHAARSASRGQEPTPSPLSTRVEDRDESLCAPSTVARARGWARTVRQWPTHLMPARERVASSADLSAPRLAPLGAETQAQHVNATSTARSKRRA